MNVSNDAKEDKNGFIDKKLGRMERWLKRCAASCGCGAWSSALMDMECLQAEARELREDLWAAVENEKQLCDDVPVCYNICHLAKIALIAMLFVLMTGFPISVDQERAHQAFWNEGSSIALLTSTEGEIINKLRSALSSGNSGRVVVTVDVPERSQPLKMTGVSAASAGEKSVPQSKAVRATETKAASEKTEKRDVRSVPATRGELSVEDVVSLIQVGQRALMTSDSAIKIIKQ